MLPGGTAIFHLQVPSTNDPVTYTATGQPPGAVAFFQSAPDINDSNIFDVSMKVSLPKNSIGSSREQRPQLPNRQLPPVVWGILLLPFAARWRRAGKRLARGVSLLLLLAAGAAAIVGLNGCGASSGFFGQQQTTYIITVTATAGNLSRSTNVTLIVE